MENSRLHPARGWTRLGREDMRLTKIVRGIEIASAAMVILSVDSFIFVAASVLAIPPAISAISNFKKKRNLVRAQDEYNFITSQLNKQPAILPNAGGTTENLQQLFQRQAKLARRYPVKK